MTYRACYSDKHFNHIVEEGMTREELESLIKGFLDEDGANWLSVTKSDPPLPNVMEGHTYQRGNVD